jgi:predicted HTH domain antitoxin
MPEWKAEISAHSDFEKLLPILSSDPNPFSALEGRARAEIQAAAGFGSSDRNRRSRRIASPVRASGSLMKSLKMQGRRSFGEPLMSIYINTYSPASVSNEVAKLLALELYREGAISLGRAAELCGVSRAAFMQIATEREVSLHYTFGDLEQDCRFIKNLPL